MGAPLKIEYLGLTYSLKDWSRVLGIPYITLQYRRATQGGRDEEWLFRKPGNPTDNQRLPNGRYRKEENNELV